jgi:hypothetical protein
MRFYPIDVICSICSGEVNVGVEDLTYHDPIGFGFDDAETRLETALQRALVERDWHWDQKQGWICPECHPPRRQKASGGFSFPS